MVWALQPAGIPLQLLLTMLPDERLLVGSFAAELGPMETSFGASFFLRPAGDRRRICLQTTFVQEVGRLRPPDRARIVTVVTAAFNCRANAVDVRLSGARTFRALQMADVDLLELRVDGAPWVRAGELLEFDMRVETRAMGNHIDELRLQKNGVPDLLGGS